MFSSRYGRLYATLMVIQLVPVAVYCYSSGDAYSGNSLFSGAYGSNSAGSYGGDSSDKGPVTAAIESRRTVEVKPVQMMSEPHEPQVIEVPSDDMPVTVHFKSQSSRVLVQQTHTPAQISEPEHTSSEDEPQRVIHEVVKPVIQEVREIIQPYRRLIQQIQPVIEQTHTVIAKGEPRPQVQPISVPGALQGSSGSSGASNSEGGASLSSIFGSGESAFKSYGSGSGKSFGQLDNGNYAASASATNSVSLKSANSRQAEPKRSALSYFTSPSSSPSSSSQTTYQKFQNVQATSSNHGYSSRRGDFREAQPTKTRISLRPAPISDLKASQTKISLRPAPVAYNKPVRQFAHSPAPSMQQYSYGGYSDMISSLHGDNAPFVTFVAQPVRFRARARA